MNTKLRCLLRPMLLLGLVLTAHANGVIQPLEILSHPEGGLFIRWHAVAGRTYFIQVSHDPEPLTKWTFAPAIEAGNNVSIDYELHEPTGGIPDKGFFRLKYTDQELAPDETVDTADFDGDGLSNEDEIYTYRTDPLNPDTDGDGLPDGWEVAHNLNPNDSSDAANLFPGSNLTNLQAFHAGVRADSNATPTNKDGDDAEDTVDYSQDTIVWDPKSGGTRWNMEPANGTTTRLYSPNDIGGSGTSVEGFNENFAVSPGGALAIVSGSKFNSEIAKWRGWFPPGGNASPTYVPGIGESSIQYSYGGNVVEAIEDGGCMVVSRSGAAVVSEGASEFALPNTTYASRHYCISRVPKGVAGDSRIVVAATRIIPNGTDYENGNSMLWIKNGAQIHAAEHTPSIGRIKAIAKNGIILGKGAIWRNGKSISLDSLVEYARVSNSSSAARFTNLEGLAMNREGAIVATADDQLNQGTGHKTLLSLLPVEFKKMWETPNKANQIVVNARRDDPATSTDIPDSKNNIYGAPRHILHIAADPADGKYHVSLDISAGMRDQFVCAAYKSGNKVNGTDKALPSSPNLPSDMLIPSEGSSQSGEDFIIKVAVDTNKNGLIDNNETPIDLEALKSEAESTLSPTVRGFSPLAVTAADSTIQGQAFGTGWTGWKPNWVGGFFVPNAIALERLFYTGNATQLELSYVPTLSLPDESLDAHGPPGDFSEWLTHHAGSQFNAEGVTTIKNYQWDAGTRISNLIAVSSPFSTLKSKGSIVSQMHSETDATVEAYKSAGVTEGQSEVFPDVNGHNLQAVLATLGKPHWSPSWVPCQTVLVGDEDGYAGAIPDDAFGTVGRSRFTNGKYWFVVKKEHRIHYHYIPDAPPQEEPYTVVAVYLRISGNSQDLYDFNHHAGGLSVPAAITQLGYSNGAYGRSTGHYLSNFS